LAAGWRGVVTLAREVQVLRDTMIFFPPALVVVLVVGLLGCEGQLANLPGDNATGAADLGVDATGANDSGGGGQAQDGQFFSSYGKQCTLPKPWTKGKCADGKADCIFDMKNTSAGFCTYPCAPLGLGTCPSLGAEFNAHKMACVYQIDWPDEKPQSYCVYVCRLLGVVYPCPKGFTCIPLTTFFGDTWSDAWSDAWCSPGYAQ
jgi:hypothetical protein